MAGQAKLTGTQGQELAGQLSEAPGGRSRGAVVLIHEWWGLNAHIRGIADRLASEGFTVFAADLYGGRVAKDATEAEQLMNALDWGRATAELRAATEALRQRAPGTKVAIMGFCMGGALTLLAAANDPGLDAAVPFYGIPPEQGADVSRIRASVLGHFAQHDDWCTPERVDSLEKKLKGANVPVEIHRYDADHAFFNDTRPEVYSRANAETAWKRTVDFLHAKLG
ncbi:dienelactone hydrolase family protein [Pyxidicoccus sp. MSG2]|uniref:dienelactone hydrolase family protein n=1 Tax=Pyxidicoccus sp. MSG2 TaxID=2996790 RepID=UPI002270823B|nr:dienelactone hydrolase family protein [Pyxidicoccus sp. MSG2]MCY1019054.1 dienelactone hydrolase family protein [Pyxidicoccus sp. MSG2]